MDPRVLPGVVLSVCALISCKMETGMPAAGGVIPPLDVAALVAGNRAESCASAEVEARVEAWLSAMSRTRGRSTWSRSSTCCTSGPPRAIYRCRRVSP